MKASDRRKIKAADEKIADLERAISKLRASKAAIDGTKRSGLKTAGTKHWRGKKQKQFTDEYSKFNDDVSSAKRAINTAISDYHDKIRALEAKKAAITGNPYMT